MLCCVIMYRLGSLLETIAYTGTHQECLDYVGREYALGIQVGYRIQETGLEEAMCQELLHPPVSEDFWGMVGNHPTWTVN